MKIALVHDWLTGMRGGEKCLAAFLNLYPDADIFTLVHIPGTTTKEIDQRVKATSFLQRLPGIKKYYRALLPLFPMAARSLDLSGYDLVISLSHAAAKNIKVDKNAKHVCYCFTPMRYIWDQSRFYFGSLTPVLYPLIQILRWWDVRGAKGVDHFVAISRFVSARIRLFYGERATVIFPPVESDWLESTQSNLDEAEKLLILDAPAFLYAGALVPYKRVDLIVDAFTELKLPLWIAGGGPDLERLKSRAGDNIKFFGRVSDGFLAQCLKKCRALIFPGIEDFGMIPVECMAAGRPVIALGRGGAKETVLGVNPLSSDTLAPCDATGVFIDPSRSGETGGIVDAVRYWISIENSFKPEVLKARAAEFNPQRWVSDWTRFAEQVGIPART